MRERMLVLLAIGFVFLGAVPSLASASTLYYSDLFPETNVSNIYSIDTGTGVQQSLMSVPNSHIYDLAGSSIPNTIYAVDLQVAGCVSRLIIINVASKTATLAPNPMGRCIWSLGYDYNHQILYGANNVNHTLYTIDTTTGIAGPPIGPFTPTTVLPGLAYDQSTDILYGTGPCQMNSCLFQIGTTSGDLTQVGAGLGFGISDIFVNITDSVMYGIGSANKFLYSVNKTTGVATQGFSLICAGTPMGLAGVLVVPPVPAMTTPGLLVFSLLILVVAVIALRRKNSMA